MGVGFRRKQRHHVSICGIFVFSTGLVLFSLSSNQVIASVALGFGSTKKLQEGVTRLAYGAPREDFATRAITLERALRRRRHTKSLHHISEELLAGPHATTKGSVLEKLVPVQSPAAQYLWDGKSWRKKRSGRKMMLKKALEAEHKRGRRRASSPLGGGSEELLMLRQERDRARFLLEDAKTRVSKKVPLTASHDELLRTMELHSLQRQAQERMYTLYRSTDTQAKDHSWFRGYNDIADPLVDPRSLDIDLTHNCAECVLALKKHLVDGMPKIPPGPAKARVFRALEIPSLGPFGRRGRSRAHSVEERFAIEAGDPSKKFQPVSSWAKVLSKHPVGTLGAVANIHQDGLNHIFAFAIREVPRGYGLKNQAILARRVLPSADGSIRSRVRELVGLHDKDKVLEVGDPFLGGIPDVSKGRFEYMPLGMLREPW